MQAGCGRSRLKGSNFGLPYPGHQGRGHDDQPHGFNEGRIVAREKRSSTNTAPTSIDEFARTDFAPAFAQAP